MSSSPIRVLVVDDHPVFAASLARVLDDESDIEVVASVGSAAAALEVLERSMDQPIDVLLADFRLGEVTGVELTRLVLDLQPDVRVVMLTASHDDVVLADALDAGCSGFVTKAETLDTVLAAVRGAAVGEAVITPALLARLLPRLAGRPRGRNPDLTPREREVLQQIVAGHSNAQIAEELVLSTDTVRNHVSSILSKLGVHSKLQAAAVAVQRGLATTLES